MSAVSAAAPRSKGREIYDEAYHEAGHAVVGHAVGLTVDWVTTSRCGLGGGKTRYLPQLLDSTQRAAVALAGYLAQRRARPGRRAEAVRGAQDDLAALDRIPGPCLLAGGRLARKLLDQRWEDVERVAAALIPGRTVAGYLLVPAEPGPDGAELAVAP